jgi:hypothetical protein
LLDAPKTVKQELPQFATELEQEPVACFFFF